jgi:hypothetical protein
MIKIKHWFSDPTTILILVTGTAFIGLLEVFFLLWL